MPSSSISLTSSLKCAPTNARLGLRARRSAHRLAERTGPLQFHERAGRPLKRLAGGALFAVEQVTPVLELVLRVDQPGKLHRRRGARCTEVERE